MGQFWIFAAMILAGFALCPPIQAEEDTPRTITVVQPMPTDARTVYLASYRTKKRALTGFKRLQARTPALRDATPDTKAVDIPRKGKFVRLYARVNGPEAADSICNALIAQLPDCGSVKREE